MTDQNPVALQSSAAMTRRTLMSNWRRFAALGIGLVLALGSTEVSAVEKGPAAQPGPNPQPIVVMDDVIDLQLWNTIVGGGGGAAGPDELGLGGMIGQPLSGAPDLEADLWICAGFWAPGADDANDPDPIDDGESGAAAADAGSLVEASGAVVAGEQPAVEDAPKSFSLAPVLPNPSRGVSFVAWTVPHESNVRVTVHDLQGRMAAVLADGPYPVGRHRIQWNARGSSGTSSPGIYFVRLETPAGIFTRRVALIQ